MAGIVDFIESLFESGQLRMTAPEVVSVDEVQSCGRYIEDFEREYRDHLPQTPPPICLDRISWATISFFRAAQFTVYREIPEQDVLQEFDAIQTTFEVDQASADPTAHYSVDLVFRFLPQLWDLSNAINRDDPVVDQMRAWAIEWPLSSVGTDLHTRLTPENEDLDSNGEASTIQFDIDAIVASPCLFQLYVDRIISESDVHRIHDERVKNKILEAIGIHQNLATRLLEQLEKKHD